MGHYYGAQHTFLDEIPLDLAETHSQGNEWLFLSYMGTQMPEKLHTVAVDYQTYTDMTMILVCLMVDEFEQKVYSHPNPAALTGAELDSIMAEVCQRYGGVAYVNMNYTDIQSYWRMVVVEQPVYYISYAVSSIAAINIFSEAQESYYGGVEVYRSLVEDTEEDELFLAATQKAGLSGPFDEKVYQDLAKRYQ